MKKNAKAAQERLQNILLSMGMNYQTSLNCKSIAEMRVDDYNNTVGDLKGYDCPICKNKGMVAFLKDGAEYFKQCECFTIRRTGRLQEDSGIKMLLDKKRFDNFDIKEEWQCNALIKAVSFTEKKEGWFFIGGKSGTGKTHLCTAMVSQLLKDRVPCRYMLWKDEATILKGKVNDPEYAALIKPFKEVPCLYIDDFLQDGTTQGSLNLAFEILNHRYNEGLMTIISSELFLQDILKARESVGGRIYEMAGEHIVHIKDGKNYRLTK